VYQGPTLGQQLNFNKNEMCMVLFFFFTQSMREGNNLASQVLIIERTERERDLPSVWGLRTKTMGGAQGLEGQGSVKVVGAPGAGWGGGS
jgi:hypothetical protein